MKTGIIDYNAGNLQSVRNALCRLERDHMMIRHASDFDKVDVVLLPGQGAFGEGMNQLHQLGLHDPLQDWLASHRPYLGICLGFQLLLEGSEESPGTKGLGRLKGQVLRFNEEDIKVPHMGWNELELADPADPVWRGLPDPVHAYFVHSYYCAPGEPEVIACHATYGKTRFAAGVRGKNLLAIQFHPEKSQDAGLLIIRNFLDSLG